MEFSRKEAVMNSKRYLGPWSTAMLKDLRLKGLVVKVETYRGAVLLSGFVNEEQQARVPPRSPPAYAASPRSRTA